MPQVPSSAFDCESRRVNTSIKLKKEYRVFPQAMHVINVRGQCFHSKSKSQDNNEKLHCCFAKTQFVWLYVSDSTLGCVQTIPNDRGSDIRLDYLNGTKI